MTVRIFERRDGAAVRYWQLVIDDGSIELEYGVRGEPPGRSSKYYGSTRVAAVADELIAKQRALGYEEVAQATAPASADEQLAAALRALAEAHPRDRERLARAIAAPSEALLARLAQPGDDAEHAGIVELLCVRGVADAAPIAARLAHPDSTERVRAARVLGSLGATAHAAAVARAACDPDPDVRRATRDALAQLGGTAARDHVDAPDGDGASALLRTADRGSLADVEQLLARGASPRFVDDDRRTALHLACARPGDRTALVARLLAAGVDPRAVDRHGRAALHHASGLHGAALIELLLDAGADLELASDNGTPLGWAALFGNTDAAMALLARGARVTPAHVETALAHDFHAFAARLRSVLGDPPASATPAALRELARGLGRKAARSARDSGDHAYYESIGNDPDDLRAEYWLAHYRAIAIEAITAAGLAPEEALLDELSDAYDAGYAE